MVAAITAAKRGHQVTLCEQSDTLGGAIRYAEHVPFKKYLNDYKNYLIRQLEQSGAEVKLNTRVTPELADSMQPDVILAAVGAQPIVPNLPGLDRPEVIGGSEAHSHVNEMGDRVVIIGGGLVGTELAIQLADLGKHPVVVEMREDYAVDSNPQHKNAIHWQKESKIDFRLSTTVTGITPEGVETVDDSGKTEVIPADNVVVAVGYRSDKDQVEGLRFVAPEFHWIGDCYRPGKVTDAVRTGYYTAMDI
jgi:NADPH-dependent 2,4-dienoyl-CoA reductase/sulfur reductase-like enzyme